MGRLDFDEIEVVSSALRPNPTPDELRAAAGVLRADESFAESRQQVCLGVAAAGRSIDVWVTDQVLQFYNGDQLLRTERRQNPGEVRKKRASLHGGRTKVHNE